MASAPWFALWPDTGLLATMNHRFVMADREWVGRGASPSAAVRPVPDLSRG